MAYTERRRVLIELFSSIGVTESSSRMHFTDDNICKMYLVGMCPHELFHNTHLDEGRCPHIHSDAMRRLYEKEVEELSARMKAESGDAPLPARAVDPFGYLYSLLQNLGRIVQRADREINRMKADLDNKKRAWEDSAILDIRLEYNKVTEKLTELEAEAERLGGEGLVDESLQILNEASVLKESQSRLQAELREAESATAASLGVASNTLKMFVCDSCPAMLSRDDSDKCLEDHHSGRLHAGLVAVRARHAELAAMGLQHQHHGPPSGHHAHHHHHHHHRGGFGGGGPDGGDHHRRDRDFDRGRDFRGGRGDHFRDRDRERDRDRHGGRPRDDRYRDDRPRDDRYRDDRRDDRYRGDDRRDDRYRGDDRRDDRPREDRYRDERSRDERPRDDRYRDDRSRRY
ncbi:hypothetical protein H696_02270 [Fonticula alba]|uniref:Uncharacterized protein n=1 Tax=Fonticula alba TaxID=691883 RepID=A0A058ZAG4_FONAL|nr:hypothetical protein H696_02270 [Fonticula alba]KCV71325.1 hypothetical protein H696_02270 [Fonticula alba]|eukprot:XP_009494448.1 hypothetical protein H696_02270 [Fonticula alba]